MWSRRSASRFQEDLKRVGLQAAWHGSNLPALAEMWDQSGTYKRKQMFSACTARGNLGEGLARTTWCGAILTAAQNKTFTPAFSRCKRAGIAGRTTLGRLTTNSGARTKDQHAS